MITLWVEIVTKSQPGSIANELRANDFQIALFFLSFRSHNVWLSRFYKFEKGIHSSTSFILVAALLLFFCGTMIHLPSRRKCRLHLILNLIYNRYLLETFFFRFCSPNPSFFYLLKIYRILQYNFFYNHNI